MEILHTSFNKTLAKKTRRRKFKRILLIDAGKETDLSAALRKLGYDLVHCDSVQEAWSFVYPRRPQLIILRLNNSNRVVLSEFRECRVLAEGVPIVLALSSPAKPALVKALQRGSASSFVVSPTVENIRETLDHLERSTIGNNNRASFGTHSWSNFQGE